MSRRSVLGLTVMAWTSDAACKGMDADLFFPDRGESIVDVVAVCETCPVAEQCLAFAVENNEKHGVWGGRSERSRRVLRRELRERRKHEVAA